MAEAVVVSKDVVFVAIGLDADAVFLVGVNVHDVDVIVSAVDIVAIGVVFSEVVLVVLVVS